MNQPEPTDEEILAEAKRMHEEECPCGRTRLDGPHPKSSGWWELAEWELKHRG